MKERIQIKKEIFNPVTFQEYFPGAEIREIKLSDVPEKILEHFEFKSGRYISPNEYKPGNFDHVFVVRYADGSFTFFAQQLKTINESLKEKLAYFVDWDKKSVSETGHSELVYNIRSPKGSEKYFKNKPFVGITETNKEFMRKGFAERRLFLMNAVSQMCYNLPVFSDTRITPDAKSLWEKLVQEKNAVMFKEGENDRYMLTAKKFEK